jgi:predicted extracellular nuclease
MTVAIAVVSSGAAVALINAWANRRQLGAETTRTGSEAHRTDAETDEVIRKTYGGMLADIQSQLDRTITKAASLALRVEELELEREDQRRVLQLHAAWDAMAISKLRECDPPVDLPMPTPLTPPLRRRNYPEPDTD